PAVFRFTAPANPARHLEAAEALGADVSRARDADAGAILADRITWFMQQLHVPNGLRALGYSSSDIPALVEGTLPQHRVTKLSPRPAGPDELSALFEDAMVAWERNEPLAPRLISVRSPWLVASILFGALRAPRTAMRIRRNGAQIHVATR